MLRTDEDLLIEYRAGNHDIFKEIVERYTPLLFSFSKRLGVGSDAPDVVQEIFIKIWKNIGRFDENKASFKTWIFRIARNSIIDFLRKKKSIVFSNLENEEEESFESTISSEEELPEIAIDKLKDAEGLNKILKQLPTNYQEVLSLYYQEEMTFDQIGEILGKSINTVKSQHRRAVLQLRKLLT